jgi:hypothetical protein
MDKNIAALLREDAKTVHVSFDMDYEKATRNGEIAYAATLKRKVYTYVTNLSLSPGDSVIVDAQGVMKVVHVISVDADVQLEPNADVYYKWVVCKVDTSGDTENMVRNIAIERTVADAYRANLKKSFSQQILSGLSEDKLKEVQLLIGKA